MCNDLLMLFHFVYSMYSNCDTVCDIFDKVLLDRNSVTTVDTELVNLELPCYISHTYQHEPLCGVAMG